LLSLLLAVISAYYSFHHLSFRTKRSDLVASDQRLIRQGENLDREFGSRDDLVVVVENGHPSRAKAFAEALAGELKKHPQDFLEIFYRIQPESLKKWALFYLEGPQLKELATNLDRHQHLIRQVALNPPLAGFFRGLNQELTGALLGELFTGFLQDDKEKEQIPDLSLLVSTLHQLRQVLTGSPLPYTSPLGAVFPRGLEDLSQEGYFLTENDKYLLFLVTPRKDTFSHATQSVNLLREIVARVKKDFPGLEAGVTGPLALEADEMNSAMADIALATWLSLASQLLLLIFFFRSLKRTLIQGLVLVVGLCWTFAVATLAVGHLNLLSVVFAPLMLGITIDYGIHWFCRLEEEQSLQGRDNGNTMACTMRQAAPGIIYAALAAAASFVPLTLTGFKGLAELGLILTLGVLLMLVATLTLLPSLVLVTERFPFLDGIKDCPGAPRPFLSLSWRRPGLVLGLGLFVAALGGLSLWHVKFDLNPLHLQNQKTESVTWELKLLKDSRYSTSFGAMTAKSLEELKAKTQALKQLNTVSHVESILSFLPAEAEAKRDILASLKPVLAKVDFPEIPVGYSQPQELALVLGNLKFKLSRALENNPQLTQVREAETLLGEILPLLKTGLFSAGEKLKTFELRFYQDFRDKWQMLREAMAAPPVGIQDLPQEVRERFVSPNGYFLIRAFSSGDIWDPKPLATFVQDLRRVDPDVVGDPVLLHVFTNAFRNACLFAAGVGLLAISFMLWVAFRSLRLTFLALIPLAVGTGWTLNLMWLLGLPFNQANVLFLPLILGEAIEFGIIILVRWQLEESARIITLPASTAKGVLLAALTTTVGFGSLMVSGHQGTFSLGLLATVGSLSVLAASLSVLPAILRLAGKRAVAPLPRLQPVLNLKRWILLWVRKEIV
jgi:hopanoid biosynthesis associated RND transporter like protein HpnN